MAKKQRLQVEKGTVADLNGKVNMLSGKGSVTINDDPGMRGGAGPSSKDTGLSLGQSEKLEKKPASMISIHNDGVLVYVSHFLL